MIVKKSEIQSIVITKDREFKHRSITFLNNIAFNAEKISVDSVEEALAHVGQNPKTLNLVIDGKEFYNLLDTYSEELKKLCKKSDLIALMFVEKAVPEETIAGLELSNLYVKKLPFEKGHFNEAFHNRGGKGGSSGVFPGLQEVAKPGANQSGPGSTNATGPKKNITAFEATAHVRDTIAMLTIIDKNRGALEQLTKIGQIFNGLVGAFAYFEKKGGFQELKHLAIIVDEISRYSDKNDKENISDSHYDLLYNSVRTSFLILQALRDNQTPKSELLEKAKQLNEVYMKTDELEKRDKIDQGEIDKLLEGNDP